jgi:hypothetical protein
VLGFSSLIADGHYRGRQRQATAANAIRLLNSGWPLLSPLSPFSGQICENPVAITTVRQTGELGQQPLDRRKTPSTTPIGDYRVFSEMGVAGGRRSSGWAAFARL